MAEPLRVGFAGAGFIANVHAGILARDARVHVHAVRDTEARAAALFALKWDARAVPSDGDLLAECDALYICTPNALHAALAVRALGAGLHVFSEKPMATSLADARGVRDAAAAARGVYQVGFNRRFASVYAALKQRIATGALVPTSALLKMNRGELLRPAWTGDPAISGGYLYETPVHMLDMARHLFGEVEHIAARARATVYGQLDDFSMLLTFASGVMATLTSCAHATWLYPFERVEVYGAHAIAATEEMDRIAFGAGVGASAATQDFTQQPFEERWGYIEEDRRFVDAALGGGEVAVSAAEGLRTAELIERCYETVRMKAE